jgi:cell division protein FtsW
VQSWLDPGADAQGSGYQSRQARYALANGGIFGDGLGQGTAKWNYLPNAHNDFIFAIIGEELGFVGAAGLLLLFGLFTYTGMRIARRSVDPFLRLLTATTTLWILGQVFINVGYVVGLLPVTGLQLPLISAGGTSTATTLLMMGIITNAARHEPEAVAALRAGRDDRMNRLLRLPMPEPYVPSRLEAARDRLRARPKTAADAKTAKNTKTAKAGGNKRKPAPTKPQARGRAKADSARRAKPERDDRRQTGHAGDRRDGVDGDLGGLQSLPSQTGGRARSLVGQRHGCTPPRFPWFSPVEAPRGTWSRRWQSPMHWSRCFPVSGSQHSALLAALRQGWCPNAVTTCDSSHPCRCPAS